MKAPKSLFDRPGRATAVVGAVVAVSATAAVALLSGTAAATPEDGKSGKCTKNVNVRAEPDTDSRIVALCEEGTAVQVAESRDGFLRLSNLGGWAAQEYVSVNGRAPAPAARTTNSEDDDSEDASNRHSGSDARQSGRAGHGSDAHRGGAGASGADANEAEEEEAGESGSEAGTDETGDSADESGDESGDGEASAPARAPRSGGIGGLLG